MGRISFIQFLLSSFGLVLISCPASAVNDDDSSSGRVVYDQRQTGKFNIHVSIKDVAIIEMDHNEFMDESINDEDYYYDDNALTVKPLPSWLTRPITTTIATSSMSTSPNLQQNTSTTPPQSHVVTSFPQTPSQTPITIPLISRHPPNNTYSPNLLADLAATQAASTLTISTITSSPNSTTTTTKRAPTSSSAKHGTKKTTNVVILSTSSEQSSAANATSTHLPIIAASEQEARSNNFSPLHIAIEPPAPLHPREHEYSAAIQKQPAMNEETIPPPRSSKREDHDSKIFKFKVKRAHKQIIAPPAAYPIPYRYRNNGQRRCRSGHFLDDAGNCRVKRSSSILRKLFSMLVSLPFNDTEDFDDETE